MRTTLEADDSSIGKNPMKRIKITKLDFVLNRGSIRSWWFLYVGIHPDPPPENKSL